MDRRSRALVALITLSIAVTFLPWGISGSVGRSSYELVDASRTLGLLEGGPARVAPLWFALPFVAAAAVLAAVLEWRRLAGTLGIVLGASMIVAALVVKSSPLGVDVGAIAGALLGMATLVVGAALHIPEGTERRDRERTLPTESGTASRAGGADHGTGGDEPAAPDPIGLAD